jgi:hypothetical protein
LVEASVTLGEALSFARYLLNIEILLASHALQRAETIERDLRASSHELQQESQVSLRVGFDYFYKPNGLLGLRVVTVFEVKVCLKVIHVETGETSDEQFQLLEVENGNQIARH